MKNLEEDTDAVEIDGVAHYIVTLKIRVSVNADTIGEAHENLEEAIQEKIDGDFELIDAEYQSH
jgi:flavin-binding protein dodecin